MQEIAYAKINLALHVRERQADGYHRIETIFAFAEEGDRLSVEEGEGIALALKGPFAAGVGAGEDNLVLRAARSLADRAGPRRGARLTLDKRLPIASGIGGGSADAAAALRLLSRWWQLRDVDLEAIAVSLGADVPACLVSRTCRGEGRGDRLSNIDLPGLTGAPLLLVNPLVPVPTPAVFRGWDGVDRGPLTAYESGRNDLEPSALAIAPVIGEVLTALRAERVRMARMSGSGATCFALFNTETARDRAAAEIAAANPLWWQLASRIR